MRIRLKQWAKKELSECEFYINNPVQCRGKWKQLFGNGNPIHLELGCGKGLFITNMAKQNPNINFIAVDMNESVLGVACRKVKNMFEENSPSNLKFVRLNVELIEGMLDYRDIIERIYINFPTPWEKSKHNKRRLTYTKQLLKYRAFLKNEGEIYFKTDCENLYLDTMAYLKDSDFEIVNHSNNLDERNIFTNNISTIHEEMYSLQGVKIKGIIAKVNKKYSGKEYK